ncbi:MAG: endolytic transglycosylase MltG [Gammaproteobacteria bacterium]|nr:endolytic transglycosylase MltG [Gammaproteobacteria bacterium]
MEKRTRYFLIVTFTILMALLILHIVRFIIFLNAPIVLKNNVFYVLKPNESAQHFSKTLQKQTQLSSSFFFRWLIVLRGEAKHLKAGEYHFPKGSKPLDVLKQVVSGRVYYHAFTIVDGWNFRDLMRALDRAPALKHTLRHHTPKQIASQLGFSQASPEGLFFPDTYRYVRGMSDIDLLKWAHEQQQKYLKKHWPKRAAHLPYKNQYQALIVASLVEKETAIPKERPLIAAVILKRLKMWMPLQIDSSVIYGLGNKFKGKLTRADMRVNTPYNTYLHYRLPPTPIAIPGASAIQAALHPTKTDALYFVAKGDGTHVFSSRFRDHKKEVLKFQVLQQ